MLHFDGGDAAHLLHCHAAITIASRGRKGDVYTIFGIFMIQFCRKEFAIIGLSPPVWKANPFRIAVGALGVHITTVILALFLCCHNFTFAIFGNNRVKVCDTIQLRAEFCELGGA